MGTLYTQRSNSCTAKEELFFIEILPQIPIYKKNSISNSRSGKELCWESVHIAVPLLLENKGLKEMNTGSRECRIWTDR
jgi:hypothetical protein